MRRRPLLLTTAACEATAAPRKRRPGYPVRALLAGAILWLACAARPALAQTVPAGKFTTTDYPEDRKQLALIGNVFDPALSLNDNYVGVGAEGRFYYGTAEELKAFAKYQLTFKSVTPTPGTELLRIFNGTTAIRTKQADVVFGSPHGDLPIRVIRTETFVKQNGKWYYVAGQGTQVKTETELAAWLANAPGK